MQGVDYDSEQSGVEWKSSDTGIGIVCEWPRRPAMIHAILSGKVVGRDLVHIGFDITKAVDRLSRQ